MLVGRGLPFEQATAVLRQRDGTLVLVQRHPVDESLVFQMPKVEGVGPRIAQVTFGDDPKRPDRREGPRFRSIEGVVAFAVVDQFAVRPAWQVQIAHEHIARIQAADIVLSVARLTVALLAKVVVALANVVLAGTIANRR